MKSYDSRGSSALFNITIYGVQIVTLLLILLPFLYVTASSFATNHEVISRGFFLIPREWTLSSYGYLLFNHNFMRAFQNAVVITVVGTAFSMLLTCLMAYGLSKKWLVGRATMSFLVLFTMVFSGGIIPTYLVVKSLHLLDSYWALWLVGAIAPFNLIVMRSFFQSIPQELEESATMEGCGELRLFWNICIPLSLPAIATFTLFYMVGNWNTYFAAILYLNDSAKWPLQVFLRQMLLESSDTSMEYVSGGFEYGQPVKMAAVLVTALPLLIVYPFFQKYFDKGMLLGSVKG
jgi:putative aldouronate transport system permease protein